MCGSANTLALDEFETVICPNILELDEFVSVKEAGQFGDALSLARELVSQRKLTRYQAFIALRGDARKLDLGRYVILDELGKGGMGQVFLAKQLRLDRDVAIKMLVADSASAWRLQRFAEEIRLCASMFHPNIVDYCDTKFACCLKNTQI